MTMQGNKICQKRLKKYTNIQCQHLLHDHIFAPISAGNKKNLFSQHEENI